MTMNSQLLQQAICPAQVHMVYGIWLLWLQSLWHQEEALENKMDMVKNNSNESIEEWAEINDDEQPAEQPNVMA